MEVKGQLDNSASWCMWAVDVAKIVNWERQKVGERPKGADGVNVKGFLVSSVVKRSEDSWLAARVHLIFLFAAIARIVWKGLRR